ncbi:MAG: hypothetical protein R8N24_03090 [Alphaproteobacteria bacterium]|nr:hypothetical protein [Alphaproteobacteria bacterium]
MKQCPWFGKCGGCKYDFTADNYRESKLTELPKVKITDAPIWIPHGVRRRADFCFAAGMFGFFEAKTKNIIPVTNCPNLMPQINKILPDLAALPWSGAGSCLVTLCENGIDIAINSNVSFVTSEFRTAVHQLPVLRVTWNGKVIMQSEIPMVSFGDKSVEYPSGAFLQPSVVSADEMRDLVLRYTDGYTRVADLFCGLGNFTFATNADGFDIVGTGQKRDLFRQPLTVKMLNNYDCVIMDPPRAGANAQCKQLARSDVLRIIYISCNPASFISDAKILANAGFEIKVSIPIDQFSGSAHWELFTVLDKVKNT